LVLSWYDLVAEMIAAGCTDEAHELAAMFPV
jgi:hypothetical protein